MQNNTGKPNNPFEQERKFVEMVTAIREKVAEIEREWIKKRAKYGRKVAREHVDKAGQ